MFVCCCTYFREFPGGPVVRTLGSPCQGPRFNPWSGNLRSHKLRSAAKKKKKKASTGRDK